MYCMLPFFFSSTTSLCGHMKRWCELHVAIPLCPYVLLFHRQCHLLAEFAMCANHWTSVSKIHVPSQSQIAFKVFFFCFSFKMKIKKKTTTKKDNFQKALLRFLKGYLFVLVSMNTNGHSHLHMKLMKMYLYIYDNLIGMPKLTTEA